MRRQECTSADVPSMSRSLNLIPSWRHTHSRDLFQSPGARFPRLLRPLTSLLRSYRGREREEARFTITISSTFSGSETPLEGIQRNPISLGVRETPLKRFLDSVTRRLSSSSADFDLFFLCIHCSIVKNHVTVHLITRGETQGRTRAHACSVPVTESQAKLIVLMRWGE